MDRYGTPPTYPSYQMALSLLGLKVAWEKAGAFLRRLDLDHRKFHQLLKHPSCPPVELMRGSGRRLTRRGKHADEKEQAWRLGLRP